MRHAAKLGLIVGVAGLPILAGASGCAMDSMASAGDRSASDGTVLLTAMGPIRTYETASGGPMLGAGDALGREIFANYAAMVRAKAGRSYAQAE
jgi:hypothetical protein